MQNKPSATPTQRPNSMRRALITYVPLGVVAAIFGSLTTAAFRFLRPVVAAPTETWIDVLRLSDVKGTAPISKKITTQHEAGWSTSSEEHSVYILPSSNNKVFSAICPHEGCEVSWQQDANVFSCPCHESFFGPDGAKLKGPATRGLDSLPTRVADGKLQVQYRFTSQGQSTTT